LTVHNEVEILVVEDNENDSELILRGLKLANIVNNVQVVRDGRAALDFVLREGEFKGRVGEVMPKLILLDLKLPKLDGLEVLRVLKSNHATKLIPVVILSSSLESRDLSAAYLLGVNSYIVKPFDLANFVKAVSTAGVYWLLVNQVLSSPLSKPPQ
jgi:two-component system response regulator